MILNLDKSQVQHQNTTGSQWFNAYVDLLKNPKKFSF